MKLMNTLDPLRNHVQVQSRRHCDHCSHDLAIAGTVFHRAYERSINLKLVDREPMQIAEARIAGPKIVDADPDTGLADLVKYRDRLLQAQKSTDEKDALIVMAGTLLGLPVVACAFEFQFMAGSMGSVVGERFVRAVEHCLEHRKPLICFSASGGARMQEALLSLLQMAKTSSALARLAKERLPYVSVLTDPTTGGVSASLAMLGDVNIGEPKALIGFAGARVIQQTVRETLPEGFQRSEFLLEHGALDMIVDRRDMRDRIAGLLAMLMNRSLPPAA